MKVNTVENTLFLGKIGGSEWEGSGDGASVHIATNHELVGGHWHSRIHSLLLLRGGNFGKDHGRAKIVFDFMLNKI